MKFKYVYLLLAVLGLILPMSQFIIFLQKYGLNIRYMLELLVANSISRFFVLDLVIASLAFLSFVIIEGSRIKMKFIWIYILSTLGIGLSFALPLFLFAREVNRETNSMNP
jgi:hypothetical protein